MDPGAPPKKRILIVDDDPALRKLLQFGLNKAGYETLTADHGGEAMAILAREPVDLITVDLMMPIIDGLRFLRWLRQEAQVTTPALVFTSYDSGQAAEEARALGATDFISKPIKLPELLEHVRRVMAAH